MAQNKPPVEGDTQNPISGGLNHGITPQTAEEKLDAAYHQLVLIQVFTTDLEKDLKKCGLKHCALLCEVVNDSLNLINTKVADRILTARGGV